MHSQPVMFSIAVGLAISIASLSPRGANAQFFDSYEWTGGNGLWSTPSKWTPSGPPDFFEVAVFNAGGVVTVPDGTTVAQFLIGDVSTTFDGGGSSHHMTVDDVFFSNVSVVGQLSTEHGVLTLQNGTFDITYLALTQAAMSHGDLIIRPSAELNSSSIGVAISPQSGGNLTVDGGTAQLGKILVAENGTGSFIVQNGGMVSSGTGDDDQLASDEFGVATATITGVNSHWNTTTLVVGKAGMATLNVTSQGGMNADQLTIGHDSGSHGSLEVQAQGIASTHQLAIGFDAGSHGSAHVDGTGSQLNIVAPSGAAIALLAADATLSTTNGGTINIGSGSGAAGSINVMSNGGLVGAGVVQGSVHNSGGTVWPSNLLSIAGSYSQTAGKLQVDISGKNAGQFGVLDITGSAQLAGTLDPRLTNGYLPMPGDQFVILHSSDLMNNGIALTPAAAALFNLSIDTINDLVVLTARGTTVAGDYNGNGVVDAADYIVWRKTLGSTTDLHANGDDSGTSQGRIDQADFVFWRSRFGASIGSGSNTFLTAVPEPNSMAMILMAFAVCLPAGYLRSND